MPPSPTIVYDLAEAMRSVIEARYSTEGVGLPTRRYVHAGEVAIDCEQLVVTGSRIFPGFPAAETPGLLDGRFARSASLSVWLLRCVPVSAPAASGVGAPPTAAALDESAAEILRDLWLVPQAVNSAYLDGDFLTRCANLAFVGAVPYGPQGSYGGVIATWEAQV